MNWENPPEIVGLIGDTGGSYSLPCYSHSWGGGWYGYEGATDFDFTTDEFGPDLRQDGIFSFIRQTLVDLGVVVELGDIFDWNYAHWEVSNINENQLVGGQVDANWAVICAAFLVRKSNLQIERIRSI